MTLNEWAIEIHQNAEAHGWWDEDRELPEILMLCVSELAEALEEYRDGKPMLYCKYYKEETCGGCLEYREECAFDFEKPEGVATEMIDCVIRILDYCGKVGIDVDEIMRIKHKYNKTRPYRHGGKKC